MKGICQSCGMPLKKDPQRGGANADGTRSAKYCSLCYDQGEFRHPGFSAKQMQDHCVEALRRKGMPRVVAWLFTRGIPRLERWRTAGAARR
jgi:hypothetical protein